MNLRGQPHRRISAKDEGYAMAALLVAMAVMAVLASAAMPVWKQLSTREKEEELVFRGKQYARAIGLFQRKMGPGVNPPTLDVLVEQRFLRKKYKDPITGDDFDPIAASANQSATPGTLPGAPSTGARGQPTPPSTPQRGSSVQNPAGGRGFGGIIGVMSKSKAQSIRIYNGRTHYNEWQFVYVPQTTAPGVVAPGGRGQRGGPSGPSGPGGFPGPGGFGGRGEPSRGNPPPFGPARSAPMPMPQPAPGN
jgi:type II secretory pathway pseudopilin PulG